MTRTGPLLTLLAVAMLAAAVFIANTAADPANAPVVAGAAPTPVRTASDATGTPTPTPVPPAALEAVYAGRTSGNELTIAIAVKDGRAVAYLCDGKKIEAWLEGTVDGGTVSLTNPRGATVTGTVNEANSLGTLTVGGTERPYSAQAVEAPAGLYEGRADVRGVANRIGWIVLPDGSQTGVLKPAGGNPRPAPILDPELGSATIDGVPVAVTTLDGGDRVVGR